MHEHKQTVQRIVYPEDQNYKQHSAWTSDAFVNCQQEECYCWDSGGACAKGEGPVHVRSSTPLTTGMAFLCVPPGKHPWHEQETVTFHTVSIFIQYKYKMKSNPTSKKFNLQENKLHLATKHRLFVVKRSTSLMAGHQYILYKRLQICPLTMPTQFPTLGLYVVRHPGPLG